jgi:hypothetical protein
VPEFPQAEHCADAVPLKKHSQKSRNMKIANNTPVLSLRVSLCGALKSENGLMYSW